MARGHPAPQHIGAKDFAALVRDAQESTIVSTRVLNPTGRPEDRKFIVTTIDENGNKVDRTYDVRKKADILKRLGKEPGVAPASGTPNKRRKAA